MNDKLGAHVNHAEGILEFWMKGFWSETESNEFTRIYRRAVDEISQNNTRKIKMLGDLRDFTPQQTGVAEAGKANVEYAMANGLVRAAHVIPNIITKMQSRKVMPESADEFIRTFENMEDARRWLKEPIKMA